MYVLTDLMFTNTITNFNKKKIGNFDIETFNFYQVIDKENEFQKGKIFEDYY